MSPEIMTKIMPEIIQSKSFYIDVSHYIEGFGAGHPNSRMHGHTYKVTLFLKGFADKDTGMLIEISTLEKAVDEVRSLIDHRLLNEIEDLGIPSSENMCVWFWTKFKAQMSIVEAVEISRPGLDVNFRFEGNFAK